MTRDEIVERTAEVVGTDDEGEILEEIGLFEGMEDAFLGIGERFVKDGHRYFAVYSYQKMVDILTADGESEEDAVDYLEFNTVGFYGGEGTPAILRDYP